MFNELLGKVPTVAALDEVQLELRGEKEQAGNRIDAFGAEAKKTNRYSDVPMWLATSEAFLLSIVVRTRQEG